MGTFNPEYDYHGTIDRFWPAIMQAMEEHGDKKPIIECDVKAERVGAYPANDYISRLSERDRAKCGAKHLKAAEDGDLVVFVRDEDARILLSHIYYEEPGQ